MPPVSLSEAVDHTEHRHVLLCPVCSGLLIPLRGMSRCSRCAFTICEGCEGGAADEAGAPAD